MCSAIDDVNSRVSTLRLLVSLLPTVNRDTLWYLLTFLSCVAKHAEDQVDDTGQTVSLPQRPTVLPSTLLSTTSQPRSVNKN